jgi:hypothetical protein
MRGRIAFVLPVSDKKRPPAGRHRIETCGGSERGMNQGEPEYFVPPPPLAPPAMAASAPRLGPPPEEHVGPPPPTEPAVCVRDMQMLALDCAELQLRIRREAERERARASGPTWSERLWKLFCCR